MTLLNINDTDIELSYFWGNREILIEKYQKSALIKAIEKRPLWYHSRTEQKM